MGRCKVRTKAFQSLEKRAPRCVDPKKAAEDAGIELLRETRFFMKDSVLETCLQAMRSVPDQKNAVHSSIKDAISGEVNACAIFAGEDLASKNFTLRATGHINTGQCIGAAMGNIRTEEEIDELLYGTDDLRNIWVNQLGMPDTYDGPKLVLDTIQCGNETRFINDPSWQRKGTANVEWREFWDNESKRPFLIYLATRAIKKGEELLMSWEGCRHSIYRIMVLHYSETSLSYHLWCSALQKALILQGHRLPSDCEVPEIEISKANPLVQFNSLQEQIVPVSSLLFTNRADQPANELIYSHFSEDPCEPAFHIIPFEVAFKRSNCKFINRVESRLPADIQKRLNQKKVSSYQQTESPQAIQVIESGELYKCDIVELLDMHNPVRYYTPPTLPSFGVVAREKIMRKEAIAVYAGLLWDARDLDESTTIQQSNMYVFGLSPRLIWSDGSDDEGETNDEEGPELVLESCSCGNGSRFINDCYTRPKFQNAEAHLAWDCRGGKKVPIVVITAQRSIRRHEEIVLDYGVFFWQAASQSILYRHAKYHNHVKARCQQLRQLCLDHDIKPPDIECIKHEKNSCSWDAYPVSYDYAYRYEVTDDESLSSPHADDRKVDPICDAANLNIKQSPSVIPYPVMSTIIDHITSGQTDPITSGQTDPITSSQTESITSGQTDSITSGQTDLITSGQTDSITCGQTDLITSGQTDPITSGQTDPITSGQTDSITSGQTDLITSGQTDPITSGQTDPKTSGETDSITSGQTDSITSGQTDLITSGETDSITSGQTDPITSGQTDPITSGQADSITSGQTDSITSGETEVNANLLPNFFPLSPLSATEDSVLSNAHQYVSDGRFSPGKAANFGNDLCDIAEERILPSKRLAARVNTKPQKRTRSNNHTSASLCASAVQDESESSSTSSSTSSKENILTYHTVSSSSNEPYDGPLRSKRPNGKGTKALRRQRKIPPKKAQRNVVCSSTDTTSSSSSDEEDSRQQRSKSQNYKRGTQLAARARTKAQKKKSKAPRKLLTARKKRVRRLTSSEPADPPIIDLTSD